MIHIIDINEYEVLGLRFEILSKSEVKIKRPFFLYKIQKGANMINIQSVERHLFVYDIDVVFNTLKSNESNYLCILN
jgi:hypothetical protein